VNYGDLFWADLPPSDGHEQGGRRPVIIFQDTATVTLPTVVVIPLTAKMSAQRFAGVVLIQPTATNGLTAPSLALVFQIHAIDARRLDAQPIGRLDAPDLAAVQAMARQLLNLP
jgi:mRNA interferase MazF